MESKELEYFETCVAQSHLIKQLQKQLKKYESGEEIRLLRFKIGELQSEIDELRYRIEEEPDVRVKYHIEKSKRLGKIIERTNLLLGTYKRQAIFDKGIDKLKAQLQEKIEENYKLKQELKNNYAYDF